MPRLLDLFCGCGGCSVGYYRAGWDVVGVDHARQPDYPFEFHRADATRFPLDGFDAVAASPPCKLHTALNGFARNRPPTLFDLHTDLIGVIRDRLVASGLPYVIENVVGAPLLDPVTYCGSSFGLRVRRHRLFESNVPLTAPPCDHATQGHPVGVYGLGGNWSPKHRASQTGERVWGAEGAKALGINWCTDQSRLSQAIPPAYTEHIGRQLLAHVQGVSA